MNSGDLLVLILAGGLVYAGYNRTNDKVVVDEVVVEYEAEEFPAPPTNPAELAILAKLDTLQITPDAALDLARAFDQYGFLVSKDASIKSLSELAKVHSGAAEWLAEKNGNPSLGGKLNAVVKELYEYKLSFLKKDGKITSIELGDINSPTRLALQQWFYGLSWKMAETYNKAQIQ